ncbi:MAG: hypothetical protein PUE71_10595 [Clostridia bacterium]|nr:hypothetical protein [Clostridia bacterium]
MTGTAGIAKAAAREMAASPFHFYFCEGDCPYDYSSPQFKDNSSSSFVNYMSGESYVRMAIVGYDNEWGIIEDIPMQEVILAPGTNSNVDNWIIESGLGQACLRGEAMNDSCIYADGIWSADTVE